jgi:hypothetical protein
MSKTQSYVENKCILQECELIYTSPNINKCDVIKINVKGKFKPNIKLVDYNNSIVKIKNTFIKKSNTLLSKVDWINSHYIFTADLTENGIKYNKDYKWKFSIYISPKTNNVLSYFNENIIDLSQNIVNILKNEMNSEYFDILKY